MIRNTSRISYLLNLSFSGGGFTEHAVSQGEQYSRQLNCVTYFEQEAVLISFPSSLFTASKAICQPKGCPVRWPRRRCAGKGPWPTAGDQTSRSNWALFANCALQHYMVGKWLSSVSFFWAGAPSHHHLYVEGVTGNPLPDCMGCDLLPWK